MKTGVALVAATMLLATPAHAHWLDQYLQATTILVGKDRVHAQLRLTPGIAIFSRVIADIDANTDGVISVYEQHAYAERVLRDITVRIDGADVPLTLSSVTFSSLDEMKEGRGVISIDCSATAPARGVNRQLTFENRHQRAMAVYLVNALVPTDPDVHVVDQNRNYEQSLFTLDYSLDVAGAVAQPNTWPRGTALWLIASAVLLFVPTALRWRRRRARPTASLPAT